MISKSIITRMRQSLLQTQTLFAGAVVAMTVVGAVGFLMERFFLRTFAGKPLPRPSLVLSAP